MTYLLQTAIARDLKRKAKQIKHVIADFKSFPDVADIEPACDRLIEATDNWDELSRDERFKVSLIPERILGAFPAHSPNWHLDSNEWHNAKLETARGLVQGFVEFSKWVFQAADREPTNISWIQSDLKAAYMGVSQKAFADMDGQK